MYNCISFTENMIMYLKEFKESKLLKQIKQISGYKLSM